MGGGGVGSGRGVLVFLGKLCHVNVLVCGGPTNRIYCTGAPAPGMKLQSHKMYF